MLFSQEFHLGSADPTSKSTEIKWKEGMNLMANKEAKRGVGGTRTFFSWFSDNMDASGDDIAEVR